MNIYKNPFAIRASERIETDEMFLELFSSEPLSHLEYQYNNGKLWNTLTYVLSSPGAGKTTLLRLFSPSVLQKITKDNDATYKKLSKMGVKEHGKISKCGVYLQMGRDYEFLEDDELFEASEQKRVFLSLLNSRIVLATLKTVMALAKIKYTSLADITYSPDEPILEFGAIKESYSGKDLLDWAATQERIVCEFLDNYEIPTGGIKGANSLFALKAMRASWFTYKGKRLCDDFIFQFDDGHKLSSIQKSIIRNEVAEKRLNVTLWIAERLETLCVSDILNDKNQEGRDYQTLRLENTSYRSLFNNMAKRTASLRSGVSYDGIGLLESLAVNSYDTYTSIYNESAKRYVARIQKLTNYNNFKSCVDHILKEEAYDKALHSRALLMFSARKATSGEITLFEYDPDSILTILEPYIPLAEEIILAENPSLPQYFGAKTIIDLSSQNIEQFLNLSSELYEKMVAKKIVDPANYELSAEEQNTIIRNFCESRLNEIKRLPRGNIIYEFILKVVEFCKVETFTDTYSYKAVTGFAVAEENSGKYGNDGFWFQEDENEPLSLILKDCLAYNLFEKCVTIQGKKDQHWSVFYLNRWICAYAHLPLSYGGWRKLHLSKLNKWILASK